MNQPSSENRHSQKEQQPTASAFRTLRKKQLRIAPFLIFSLFWMAVIVIEMQSFESPDLAVARWANSFIGQSHTYDLTLSFFLLRPGDILGITVMTLLLLTVFRKHSDARLNLGHYAAFFLLVLLNIWIAYELIETLQDHIHFLSPAAVLTPFNHIGDLYGSDVNLIEQHNYPSERTTFYYLVAFLALSRFGWDAARLFFPPLIFCLPRLLAGAEGITSIIGGFLLAWFFAAFNHLLLPYYLAAEQNLGRLYEGKIARNFLRLTAWLANLPARIGKAQPFQMEKEAEIPDQPLERDLSNFIEREWGLTGISIKHPPIKGKLYRIFTDQGVFALKIAHFKETRWAFFRENRRDTLEKALALSQEINREGLVRTPALAPAKDGSFLKSYGERLVYIADWMDGRRLDIITKNDLRQLMRSLAVLHQTGEQRMTGHGLSAHDCIDRALGKMRTKSAFLKTLDKPTFREKLARIISLHEIRWLVESIVRAETMARFAYLYAFEDQSQPRICMAHRDPHPRNLLIDPNGSLVILDFDRSYPDLGYVDLVLPLRKLMERHQWDFDFLEPILREYIQVRDLSRFEIVLLFASMLYPQWIPKIRGGKTKIENLKVYARFLGERILGNMSFSLKRKFTQAAAQHYQIPLIALAYAGPIPEVLLHDTMEKIIGQENKWNAKRAMA